MLTAGGARRIGFALRGRAIAAGLLCWPIVAPASGDRSDPAQRADGVFTVERRLDLDVKTERNVVPGAGRHAAEIEPLLQLKATYQPGPRWLGFAEIEFGGELERESARPSRHKTFLRIDQLYLGLEHMPGNIDLRVGRWAFRDEREWLFDANIDGVHARFDDGSSEVDAIAGRVRHWRRDLLNDGPAGDPINTLALLARREIVAGVSVGGYVVLRHDVSGRQGRLAFIGLRSHGEPSDAFRYWAELAQARGNDGERDVLGHGLDLGGTYSFDAWRWRPRVLLGYARGSGDRDPNDGTDATYRQTGLQSNEARAGSLAKHKFYGEALDPELSNLTIASAGIGFSPDRRVSVDLLLHRYTQPVPSQRLAVAPDLGEDTAQHRYLGTEIDLVVGCQPDRAARVAVAVGRFQPGGRFGMEGRKAADVLFARFEVNIKF
jgi:alginate production protein